MKQNDLTKNMLDKYLYRTEMSIQSPRKAIDVMLFEISELHNTDILEYVRDHYELPGILKRNINDVIDDIDNLEPEDENVGYMLGEILGCIEDETGVMIKYAIWLASKDSVIDNYEGDEHDIYGYSTEGSVILSDLGYDGILLGFNKRPEPSFLEEPELETGEDDYDDEDDDF